MMKLHGPRFVNFSVVFEGEEEIENMRFEPPKEDVAMGYRVVFADEIAE
jgi:hypothetical protein